MRVAVLGSPIAHSLSPVMHRAAYAHVGVDWTYDAIDVPAGGLADFVSEVGEDWRGFSVTAPLKPEAAAFATARSAVVDRLAVANTLIREASGWTADNTDVPGAVAAWDEAGIAGIGSVRILGGGSTAAAMAYAVATAGAERIEIVVRDPARADAAVSAGLGAGAQVGVVRLDEPVADRVDLLISTVPAQAVEHRAAEWVGAAGAVFDVIYDPWPTTLAVEAESGGITVVSGLDLLAHQAVLQLQQMAGVDVDAELLRSAARSALADR